MLLDPVVACFTIEDYLEVAISYSVIVCWGSIAPVTRLGSEHLLIFIVAIASTNADYMSDFGSSMTRQNFWQRIVLTF